MTECIRHSGVSERHARALLRLDEEEKQRDILDRVTRGGLTVRECEALVSSIADTQAPKLISRAKRRESVGTFLETLKGSLNTLTSMGIETSIRRSYHGEKMYLTISIEDRDNT
jgi:ParB family chromosome partitioning protein